ncbi:STAS domain-containing protein [Roseibacterium sp. SDUM158017]|uniref:STAS domain-containing protein n=1 Tax=Roseicyclus salinarum TaxID=3036773 RepID=UPI002414ED2A|nr:STAS domain-containing protein [Roseibacterium sp. SDUM158017]MDG4649238.1 STAS domain-containing protein [Roseibacterium sp. SDUM158017]
MCLSIGRYAVRAGFAASPRRAFHGPFPHGPIVVREGETELQEVLKLPERLDVAGARSLHEAMLPMRGEALMIDAAAVEKMGALAIEVLLSGARQWAEDARPFCIVAASAPFRDTCKGLGLTAEFLTGIADTFEGNAK